MRNNSTLNMTDKGNTIPDVNIPIGSIVELVIFLILLENFFILLTIRAYKKRKVVDLLILSLAGSDFVNALLPLQLLNIKAHFIISPWQQWLCGSFIWATYTLRLAALSTISLMSIEKAVLLFQPLRYYTQLTFSLMRKVVFIAWISSAIIATVPISLTKNQEQNKDVNCHYHPYHFGIEFCIFIETIGMIHFVIVLGSYIAMLVSSKDFRRRQKSMWYSQRSVREYRGANKRKKSCIETQGMLQARQLCRVVGYVVVLYYVTWLPFLIYNFYRLLTQNTEYNKKMSTIVGTFSLAAPIITPILYVKMSTRYREGIRILLRKITSFGSERKTSETSIQEMSTFDGRSRAVTALTVCESGSTTAMNKH